MSNICLPVSVTVDRWRVQLVDEHLLYQEDSEGGKVAWTTVKKQVAARKMWALVGRRWLK